MSNEVKGKVVEVRDRDYQGTPYYELDIESQAGEVYTYNSARKFAIGDKIVGTEENPSAKGGNFRIKNPRLESEQPVTPPAPKPQEQPKTQQVATIAPDKFVGWFNVLKDWMTAEENQQRIMGTLQHVTQAQVFQAMQRLVQHVKGMKDTQANPVQSNIMKCTFDSILDGLLKIIEWDIPLGDGRIYTIPYGDKLDVTAGYLGYIYKATSVDPDIKSIEAKLIFNTQEYAIERGEFGDIVKITGHGEALPNYTNVKACVFIMRRVMGGRLFEFTEAIPKHELDIIKSKSKMKSGGPNVEFVGEMMKKATVRRGLKMEMQRSKALSDGLSKMVEADNTTFDMQRPTNTEEARYQLTEGIREDLQFELSQVRDQLSEDRYVTLSSILDDNATDSFPKVRKALDEVKGGTK
jgi:recombinational DNA repair protein RecT